MKKCNYEKKANRFFEKIEKEQISNTENSATFHLLSNPKNEKRIEAALEEYKQGKGQEKKLNG